MRLDAHVHLLAARNRNDEDSAYRSEGAALYREMSTPHCRRVWQRATEDQLLAAMDSNEIDKAIAFGFPWRTPERCRWDNEYVAECVARSSGRVFGLAVFQPLAGADAVAEVERCFTQHGFVGVKIKAQMQGHSLADEDLLRPVLEVVRDHGGIVLVHVEQAWKESQGNGPGELLEFLAAFPDVRVIAAHFGGMAGMYFPYPALRERFQNVVFDSALGTAGDTAAAYAAVGLGDRVVFASDFPGARPDEIIRSLQARLDGTLLRDVLGDNLMRWMGDLLGGWGAPTPSRP